MPSRINIGPEDGPYVAINEFSGNLQLEDNSGNVVAEWDETNAQWDFANNTLNNVDALNSNSLNTEELTIDDLLASEVIDIYEQEGDADETFTVDFEGLSAFRNYRLYFPDNWTVRSTSDFGDWSGYLQFNGDDADENGNYEYWDSSGTKQENQDQIPIVEVDTADRCGGIIDIGGGRAIGAGASFGRFYPARRCTNFVHKGQWDGPTEELDSIQLTIGGMTDGEQVVLLEGF